MQDLYTVIIFGFLVLVLGILLINAIKLMMRLKKNKDTAVETSQAVPAGNIPKIQDVNDQVTYQRERLKQIISDQRSSMRNAPLEVKKSAVLSNYGAAANSETKAIEIQSRGLNARMSVQAADSVNSKNKKTESVKKNPVPDGQEEFKFSGITQTKPVVKPAGPVMEKNRSGQEKPHAKPLGVPEEFILKPAVAVAAAVEKPVIEKPPEIPHDKVKEPDKIPKPDNTPPITDKAEEKPAVAKEALPDAVKEPAPVKNKPPEENKAMLSAPQQESKKTVPPASKEPVAVEDKRESTSKPPVAKEPVDAEKKTEAAGKPPAAEKKPVKEDDAYVTACQIAHEYKEQGSFDIALEIFNKLLSDGTDMKHRMSIQMEIIDLMVAAGEFEEATNEVYAFLKNGYKLSEEQNQKIMDVLYLLQEKA